MDLGVVDTAETFLEMFQEKLHFGCYGVFKVAILGLPFKLTYDTIESTAPEQREDFKQIADAWLMNGVELNHGLVIRCGAHDLFGGDSRVVT